MISILKLSSLKLAKTRMSVGAAGIGEYTVTTCDEPHTVDALMLISNGVLSTRTLVFGVSNY